MVIDVDYRGSAGYGRDWRTAIYGTWAARIWTIRWTRRTGWRRNRAWTRRSIGLYGGSYGGFITLMAMFTQPDVFAAGAALRPVSDWAHYNHRLHGRTF